MAAMAFGHIIRINRLCGGLGVDLNELDFHRQVVWFCSFRFFFILINNLQIHCETYSGRGTSIYNVYCDGDDDNDDDEYNDGDDSMDGFAHNDFDGDDGDCGMPKRNLDNNKAAPLHVRDVGHAGSASADVVKPTGVSVNVILSMVAKWITTIPTDTR